MQGELSLQIMSSAERQVHFFPFFPRRNFSANPLLLPCIQTGCCAAFGFRWERGGGRFSVIGQRWERTYQPDSK